MKRRIFAKAAGLPQSETSNASVRWVCQRCGWSATVEMPGFAGSLDASGVHCHWVYPSGGPCGPLVGHFQGYPAVAPAADPWNDLMSRETDPAASPFIDPTPGGAA